MWGLLGSARWPCGTSSVGSAVSQLPAGIFQTGPVLALRLSRMIALEGCVFWRMSSASGRGFWGQPGAELGVRLLTRLSQALAPGSSRLWMLMSHRHLRWGPGCGILSPRSPSPGASSVAGEGTSGGPGSPPCLAGVFNRWGTGWVTREPGWCRRARASSSPCANGIFSGVVAPL